MKFRVEIFRVIFIVEHGTTYYGCVKLMRTGFERGLRHLGECEGEKGEL